MRKVRMPTLHDLRLLLRLNVTLMVGAATAFGFLLAVPLPFGARGGTPVALACVVAGAMLLAAACSAWNQAQERDIDALLPRTAGRPLPAGRMTPGTAVGLGALLFVGALGCLFTAGAFAPPVDQPSAFGSLPADAFPVSGLRLALVGAAIAVVYNGAYTPLKRVTAFALLPGALVGAMPPLLGWMAAGGDPADPVTILLYGVYVLWQVPHFWLRAQRESIHYARAGLPVPPAQYAAERYGRLLRVWYHAYAVAVLMLPVFPLLRDPLTRAGVVGLGVALLAAAALPRRAKRGGTPEGQGLALRVADAAMPALMLLLLLDRVLPLF
ncbi:ubiA prenyltransferase family protein [Desulfovibrio sp. A2]|nr:ubiA prenyltransferase family protein [Desulfovibrio sp. A2]